MWLGAAGLAASLWLGLPPATSVAVAGKDTGVGPGTVPAPITIAGPAMSTVADADGRVRGAVREPVLLVMGDSLSAAFGIPVQQGWVALLGERLRAQGSRLRVVNASVSGETTQGGVTRLPTELARARPTVVVIELGANDGLRGQSLEAMRDNLRRMVRLSQEAGARVLLVGMRIPPNYGPQYGEQFFHSFETVASETRVPLVRFFLERVALRPDLMQEDGLHPTAQAQPLLLDTVWPALRPFLPRPADGRQKPSEVTTPTPTAVNR